MVEQKKKERAQQLQGGLQDPAEGDVPTPPGRGDREYGDVWGTQTTRAPSSASVAAPDYKTGVVYSLVEAQSRPEHDQRLAERFSTQQQKTLQVS